jgi:hypothetical protein
MAMTTNNSTKANAALGIIHVGRLLSELIIKSYFMNTYRCSLARFNCPVDLLLGELLTSQFQA